MPRHNTVPSFHTTVTGDDCSSPKPNIGTANSVIGTAPNEPHLDRPPGIRLPLRFAFLQRLKPLKKLGVGRPVFVAVLGDGATLCEDFCELTQLNEERLKTSEHLGVV